MKKRLCIAALSVALTLSFTCTSFAGQWIQNERGWRYRLYDGSYLHTETEEEYEARLGYSDNEAPGGIRFPKPEGQIDCCIDGNGDGIAEIYYFDEEGYLLTDTIAESANGTKYQVNQDGARLDENGSVERIAIPQGTIDPAAGRGVINQFYLNLLLTDLKTLESSIVNESRTFSPGYDGAISVGGHHPSDISQQPVGYTIKGDKVIAIGGYCDNFLTDPDLRGEALSQKLGITAEKRYFEALGGGYGIVYTWTLQENPKVVMRMRDSLVWLEVE